MYKNNLLWITSINNVTIIVIYLKKYTYAYTLLVIKINLMPFQVENRLEIIFQTKLLSSTEQSFISARKLYI